MSAPSAAEASRAGTLAATVRGLVGLLSRGQRRQALGLLALLVVSGLLEAVSLGAVLPFVALVSGELAASPTLGRWLEALPGGSREARLVGLGALLALLFVVKDGLLAWRHLRQARLLGQAHAALSVALFRAALRRSYLESLRQASAEVIKNVVAESHAVAVLLGTATLSLLAEGVVTLALLTWLAQWDLRATLVLVALAGGFGVAYDRLLRAPSQRWSRAQQRAGTRLVAELQQELAAYDQLVLSGAQPWFVERFARAADTYGRAAAFARVGAALPRVVLELLVVLGLIALSLAAEGSAAWRASLPALAALALGAVRLVPSLHRALSSLAVLRFHAPSLESVQAALSQASPEEAARAPHALEFRRELRLEGVGFTHPGAEAPTLTQVNVSLAPGDWVGVVGPSGSGKSTLAALLCGLLPPSEGTVWVDGAAVRLDHPGWYERVGLVPQTVALGAESLRENIAFGVAPERVDEARVLRACDTAGLGALVAGWPSGLETPLGERGVRLSGGQRQRVALARALYREPQLLVLDEAMSGLDDAAEQALLEGLAERHPGMTVLLVTHRLSSLRACQRLLHVESGRVEEVDGLRGWLEARA